MVQTDGHQCSSHEPTLIHPIYLFIFQRPSFNLEKEVLRHRHNHQNQLQICDYEVTPADSITFGPCATGGRAFGPRQRKAIWPDGDWRGAALWSCRSADPPGDLDELRGPQKQAGRRANSREEPRCVLGFWFFFFPRSQ